MDRKGGKGPQLSDSKDTLIEDYEYSLEYPVELPDAYSHHGYWMMTDARDEIENLGLSENPKVKELDRKLLKNLKKYGPPAYMEKERPDRWWWHLDEIAKKQYPPEKLPEHLRDIYLKY